ncbi:hypothetical protein CYMTET_47592 [Cymbomonas tetramitiformis]|uniref:Phospholipid/glycerol acyltransferase domain-containing protein n=1 Tax=Cymbomonas tetramitiformis TaxID=36881 RepID=A0AAE0BTV1_9CHLO|nr:hypothetical protein CYMTET_47592 [Cymbomonas tetramitiformis]
MLGYKRKFDEDGYVEPMGAWRGFCLRAVICPLSRLLLFVMGFHWIRVHGRGNIPANPAAQRGTLVVANHVSLADSFYLASLFMPSFVFKHDIAHLPLMGTAVMVTQGLAVDRANRMTGSVSSILTHRMDKGTYFPTAVFPEGTTTNERYLLKFRSGAFVAGKPVYPIVLRYPFRFKSPYYGSSSIFNAAHRILCQFHNSMEVTFLPQYFPNEAELKDPKLYAENVRQLMRSEMKYPPVFCTECSNQEYIDFHQEVEKRGCLPENALTEEDFEKYKNMEPFLLCPTHLARKHISSIAKEAEFSGTKVEHISIS